MILIRPSESNGVLVWVAILHRGRTSWVKNALPKFDFTNRMVDFIENIHQQILIKLFMVSSH
ncbi:hypothetical protein VINI7043_00732 [Vibrio nigripulchritudo ATCC 27043]|nr:hypothetical protein VINI7043_00732 [Vibrio nigripulchritudo ATCC 27043]